MSDYNGWTNYETWNVALHIGNEEGSYNHWREITASAWENSEADPPYTRIERATLDLAYLLRKWLKENNPLIEHVSIYSDLLDEAISRVDKMEIAEHWIEDHISELVQLEQ